MMLQIIEPEWCSWRILKTEVQYGFKHLSSFFFRDENRCFNEVISMLFFDFTSGRYFLKDENDLINQLNGLEERAQKGENLLWDDYYHAIGLPSVAFGKEPIARKEYGGIFEFELLPSEDYTVIYVNR